MSTTVNDKLPEESNRDPETEGQVCSNQLPIWNVVKRECSVLDCDNNSSKCNVFAFPECKSNEQNYRDKCRIWLKACGNQSLLDLNLANIHEQAFICSLHFDDNQFKDETRKELIAIAVPSMHLPIQIPTHKLDEYFAQFSSGACARNDSQHNGECDGAADVKREGGGGGEGEAARVTLYKCPSCTKQFPDQDACDTHWKLIHCDEGPLECTLCNKTFMRGCDYRRHCRIHTTKLRHVCVECEKCFANKAAFDKHLRASHSADSPYVCEPCNRRFSSTSCLKSHMRVHDKEKKFACTLCAQEFFTNSSLKAHRLTHTSKDCKCKVCGKIYPDKKSLKDHFEEHVKDTPFACDICSRRFPSQKFFLIHMRTHKEICLKCKDCNKRFSTEESLQAHTQIHLDAEPAICPHCKTRFSSLTRLVQHYCKSLRGKRNVCPVCSQQFSAPSVLEIHMAIHNNTSEKEPNKPYACPECYQRFVSKGRLDWHMKAAHKSGGNTSDKEPNKPYACSECYKRFVSKGRLDWHMMAAHKSGGRRSCTRGSRVATTDEEDTKSSVEGIAGETEHRESVTIKEERRDVDEDDEGGQQDEGEAPMHSFPQGTTIAIKLEPGIEQQFSIKSEPVIEQDSIHQDDEM